MSKIYPSLPVPETAGIGLRSRHINEILSRRPRAGWLEVHAENYMGESAAVSALEKIRETYPLSMHGVGLSLGSAGGLDRDHLERLRRVCRRFQPALFSEHLAWSVADGAYLNDLLPLRYDAQALAIVAANVSRLQDTLQRRVYIENLSAYVAFEDSTMTEADFLAELVRLTGCGLLLDVNNVYVASTNQLWDPIAYIDAYPLHHVGEIHLAGHAREADEENRPLLIDTHDRPVDAIVWDLYAHVLSRIGPVATLIEWDADLPEWPVLAGEAARAEALMREAASGEIRSAAE